MLIDDYDDDDNDDDDDTFVELTSPRMVLFFVYRKVRSGLPGHIHAYVAQYINHFLTIFSHKITFSRVMVVSCTSKASPRLKTS